MSSTCLASSLHSGSADLEELRVNPSVAEGAVAQLEGAQSRIKGLMLADLASIVLLGQDTLARGDTGREVTTTLPTIDIELRNKGLAVRLGALELLLLLIGRRMTSKELEGKVLILLTLLCSQCFQSFKLDKGL